MEKAIGGPNAWIDAYGILGLSKLRFYAPPMREVLEKFHPWTKCLNDGLQVAANSFRSKQVP